MVNSTEEQTKEKIAYMQIPEQFYEQMKTFESTVQTVIQLNNSYRKLNVAICGNCTHLHTVRKSTGPYSSTTTYRCTLLSETKYENAIRSTVYKSIEVDGWCGHHQYEVEEES
jgi:hypothetical protein